jgi:hypothetical protein
VHLASCIFEFEDEEGEDSQTVTVHRVGNVYNVPQAMREGSAVCSITAEGQPVDGLGDWARWVYARPSHHPAPHFRPL